MAAIIAPILPLLQPLGWLLLLGALAIMSFGVWGIADREASERVMTARLSASGATTLRVLRGAAAVIGTLAATLFTFLLCGVLIGRIIS